MGEAANGTAKQRSQRDQGLALGAPNRLLSSIPDRVAGQESQFAEFPKNVFLRLAPTKENILAIMYPTFSGVMNQRDPPRSM